MAVKVSNSFYFIYFLINLKSVDYVDATFLNIIILNFLNKLRN